MNLVTRQAVDDDRAFILDCFMRAMRPSLTAWRGEWNELRERARFVDALDLHRTTVIEADAVAVGFVMIVELPRVLQVHTIAIAPEHQGRGIGSEIVRDLVDIGRQTGRDVVLSVLKTNPRAEALYIRLGFCVVEETEYYRHLRWTSPSSTSAIVPRTAGS